MNAGHRSSILTPEALAKSENSYSPLAGRGSATSSTHRAYRAATARKRFLEFYNCLS
jgi:hypothetical protein